MMAQEDAQQVLIRLERRVALLERRQKIALPTIFAVVLGLIAFLGWKAGVPETPETLRVRRLAIIDDKGTERVVLASPVPDPQMGGARQKRRSPATGMVINDASGDERGGFSLLDDGSMVSCLDGKSGEGTCMFVLPSGARGLMVDGEKGVERATLGLTGPDGSPFSLFPPEYNGIVLRDSKGTIRSWIGIDASGRFFSRNPQDKQASRETTP